jgi:hypothetical protein
MTGGLKISLNLKRELYWKCKHSNDQTLKDFYKLYCKILSRLKTETGRKTEKERITIINYNDLPTDDQQAIATIFSSYFSSIADEIIATNTNGRNIKSNSGEHSRGTERVWPDCWSSEAEIHTMELLMVRQRYTTDTDCSPCDKWAQTVDTCNCTDVQEWRQGV